MSDTKETKPQSQTVTEMELEIKAVELTKKKAEAEAAALDLENRKLEKRERELNLRDLKDRVDEREINADNKFQRYKTNAKVLDQEESQRKAVQSRCSHRKGGNGLEGYTGGKGQSDQYAVLKHQFTNGDIWVRCLRCAKTWKPPVISQHTFNAKGEVASIEKGGKFNQVSYEAAMHDYRVAVDFPTLNTTSGSVMHGYKGTGKLEDGTPIAGDEWYREQTKNVDLR